MELNTEQQRTIKKIAEENGFTNFEIKLEGVTEEGDNYAGIINKVVIKNSERCMVLLVKSTPKPESGTVKQKIGKMFPREIYIYETVLEEFASLEEEYNIANRFRARANMFGRSDKENDEYLILEDMREKGFEMFNRLFPMNSFHIEAILLEYAKYHSLSLAMRAKRPERMAQLTNHLNDLWKDDELQKLGETPELVSKLMVHPYKAAKGDIMATAALKKFENYLPDFLRNVEKMESPEYTVITHGDGWCNNFLFKYKDDNKENPSEVCIIDWQIAKPCSPADDLACCLLANGSEEVFKDYQSYIRFYHNAVCANLKDFSDDPNIIFPYEHLEKMFGIFCKFVLFRFLLAIQMMDDETIEQYSEKLKSIITFMMNNNWF